MFQLFQRPTCPLLRDSSDIDYKYYKKQGEWDERGVYGPFMGLYMAAGTFVLAVALLLDKYLG